MKNHLGSIRMITEGLLNKYFQNRSDEDEEKKYLTLIDKQLVECINVPERLLKMAQFSQEEQSKFSLQSGIHDVISLLDYEAKRNGISISFQRAKEASLLGNEADFKMIYRSGRYKLSFSPAMQRYLKEHQRDFMPEDTKAGMIQAYLDKYTGETVVRSSSTRKP